MGEEPFAASLLSGDVHGEEQKRAGSTNPAITHMDVLILRWQDAKEQKKDAKERGSTSESGRQLLDHCMSGVSTA